MIDFLPAVTAELEKEPTSVINKLEGIREHCESQSEDRLHLDLTRWLSVLVPGGFRISVAGDVMAMDKPRSAWSENFIPMKVCLAISLKWATVADMTGLKQEIPTLPLPDSRATMTKLGIDPSKQAVVVAMASIEGSFATVYGKGPVGWNHKDLPAIMVAAGVLNALESYFWVRFANPTSP